MPVVTMGFRPIDRPPTVTTPREDFPTLASSCHYWVAGPSEQIDLLEIQG
jgi:hypothetical protein